MTKSSINLQAFKIHQTFLFFLSSSSTDSSPTDSSHFAVREMGSSHVFLLFYFFPYISSSALLNLNVFSAHSLTPGTAGTCSYLFPEKKDK